MISEMQHATTTAIYFPHIDVPQSSWFTQILLYWDKVASIVPEGLEHEDGRLNPYMQELHAAQLLDYVRPGEALSYRSGGDFDAGFIRILESKKPAPEEPRRFTEVHFDKMGYPLFLELQRRGLAQAIDGRGYDWWQIETTTAAAYMGYIASAIRLIRSQTPSRSGWLIFGFRRSAARCPHPTESYPPPSSSTSKIRMQSCCVVTGRISMTGWWSSRRLTILTSGRCGLTEHCRQSNGKSQCSPSRWSGGDGRRLPS